MKLYIMKCIGDNGADDVSGWVSIGTEYFVKLETKEETYFYNETDAFWAGYMTAKLGIELTDEDVHYYLYPHEKHIDIGEPYEDTDGLVWERVE